LRHLLDAAAYPHNAECALADGRDHVHGRSDAKSILAAVSFAREQMDEGKNGPPMPLSKRASFASALCS